MRSTGALPHVVPSTTPCGRCPRGARRGARGHRHSHTPTSCACYIVPAHVWAEALRLLGAGTHARVSVDDVWSHPGLADPASRDAVLHMVTLATLAGPILHALRTPSDVQWLQRVFAAAPIRDAPSVPGAPSEGTNYRVCI